MRLLLTLAVLFTGCLAGSYAVAPVPKERPKTTAEKLIGTWRQVKLNGRASNPREELTFEFKKDGKVTIRHRDERGAVSVEEATYRVEKDILHFANERRPKYKVQNWKVIIKELTRGKIVTLGPDSPVEQEDVLERIKTNDRR